MHKCKGRCPLRTRSDLDMDEKQRSFQRHCWTPVAHNKARRKKTSITLVFFQQGQGLRVNAGPVSSLDSRHFGIRLGLCLGGGFGRFLFGFGFGATFRLLFCSGRHISFGIFGCGHGRSRCSDSCCSSRGCGRCCDSSRGFGCSRVRGSSRCCNSCRSFGCGRVCCCGSRCCDSCRRQGGRLGECTDGKKTGNEGGEQLVHDQNSFIRFSVQHFVELATTTPPAPVLMTRWALQL